jgi:Anion-transporting ATPase
LASQALGSAPAYVCQLNDVMEELHRYGRRPGRLIINNVVEAMDSAFLTNKAHEQRSHLERLSKRYAQLPTVRIPLFPHEIRGIERCCPWGACCPLLRTRPVEPGLRSGLFVPCVTGLDG